MHFIFCIILLLLEGTLTGKESLDVAIIGAGHAGKGLCDALQKEGIKNIALFEAAQDGQESIWLTTARMNTLRSDKECVGPALSQSHLTFRAWYESQGRLWEEIEKAPTHLWGEYLLWFGKTLNLPIFYEWKLLAIKPSQDGLDLIFDQNRTVHTKKVILATGRDSFGGISIPLPFKDLPKTFWYHTSERINSALFRDKKICVLGSGASGFDIAATAIESGSYHVDMLSRREEVKTANYLFLHFKNWIQYFDLPDEEKVSLLHKAFQHGFCPPPDALKRVAFYPQFHLHLETVIQYISPFEHGLILHTNQGNFTTDYLILATGFQCNPFFVPQISGFVEAILLWKDVIVDIPSELALFPYLGKSFEFMERTPGSAPFLKHIYCFNYGSYLSHGNTGIDIDQFPIGAQRIVEGIKKELHKQ